MQPSCVQHRVPPSDWPTPMCTIFSSLPYVCFGYVMHNGNDLLYIEFAMTTNVPKLKHGASLVYKCYHLLRLSWIFPGPSLNSNGAPGDVQGGLNRYVNLTEKILLPYACQDTPRNHKNLNHIPMCIPSVSSMPVVLSCFFSGGTVDFQWGCRGCPG